MATTTRVLSTLTAAINRLTAVTTTGASLPVIATATKVKIAGGNRNPHEYAGKTRAGNRFIDEAYLVLQQTL